MCGGIETPLSFSLRSEAFASFFSMDTLPDYRQKKPLGISIPPYLCFDLSSLCGLARSIYKFSQSAERTSYLSGFIFPTYLPAGRYSDSMYLMIKRKISRKLSGSKTENERKYYVLSGLFSTRRLLFHQPEDRQEPHDYGGSCCDKGKPFTLQQYKEKS
jgi:hypothetical protein